MTDRQPPRFVRGPKDVTVVIPQTLYFVCADCGQEAPWSWATRVTESGSSAICESCSAHHRGDDFRLCRQCGAVGTRHYRPGNDVRHGLCAECRDQKQAAEREWRAEQRAKLAASKGKTCEHCGATFDATRPDARYCSTTCRVAAHRKRQRTSSN